jgi:hypothetical protein
VFAILSAYGTWSIDESGNLTVKKVTAKEIETEKLIVSKQLEILAKIQLRDQATGEIYCTWIENGEWKKVLGECANLTPTPQPVIQQAGVFEPEPSTEPVVEQVVESVAQPTVEPLAL